MRHLTGSEIEDLINKNIYPSNKEDLKVEEDGQGSLRLVQ